MLVRNGRRQLLKMMHRGEKTERRVSRSGPREGIGYYDRYDSMYLVAGTLLGFGMGYLAAYYLRRGILTREGGETEPGEMTDWGPT